MYTVLNVTGNSNSGNMGHVFDNFDNACKIANKFHFDGVNIDLHDKNVIPLKEMKALLTQYNLIPASCGCSVKFNEKYGDREFEDSLEIFKKDADSLNHLGCYLVTTSMDPFGANLNFYDNFRQTAKRLGKVKNVLKKHGIKLAIEFVGASTRRLNVPFDFVHTIDGVRSLIAAAEMEDHAGIVLDCYHWTASGGGILDIMHLNTDNILYVELNDGSSRYDIYTLPEYSRELPLTTGIVNAEGILEELTRKNYKGPIAIEPWNDKINKMEPEEAVKQIKIALDDCMRIVTY